MILLSDAELSRLLGDDPPCGDLRTVTASLDIYNAVMAGELERAGIWSIARGAATVLRVGILRCVVRSANVA